MLRIQRFNELLLVVSPVLQYFGTIGELDQGHSITRPKLGDNAHRNLSSDVKMLRRHDNTPHVEQQDNVQWNATSTFYLLPNAIFQHQHIIRINGWIETATGIVGNNRQDNFFGEDLNALLLIIPGARRRWRWLFFRCLCDAIHSRYAESKNKKSHPEGKFR